MRVFRLKAPLTAFSAREPAGGIAPTWRARGVFNGTARLEGFDPNGAEIEMVGCDLLTIEDGKLVDNQAYTNSMELARQLGAMPPQGSRAEKAINGAFNLKTRLAGAIRRRREPS